MAQPHLSSTAIGVVLAVVAGVFYGLTKMYGARMDRERPRERKARKDDEHDV